MLTIDLFEDLEGPPEPNLIDALRDFLPIAVKHLKIKKLPKIKLLPDVDTEHLASFGKFSNEDRMVHVDINNRHPNDVLRTLAHELTHYAQGEQDRLDADSWQTGSSIEDEANAEAGVIMREFNQQFPQYMELKPIVLPETWTKKYKKSINCSNPKGFSQKAHCAARRARQAGKKTKSKSVSEQQLDEKCWPGYHKEGNKKMFGKTYPNCVKNKKSNEDVAKGKKELPQWKKDWYAKQKPNSWPKHPQPYHNPYWIDELSPEERKKLIGKKGVAEDARIARKPGQPAKSKQHSDLYTDEDPRGTITGLKFATVEDARASVTKIRRSGRSHAHKIQAAVAMEQRAKAAGKASAAAVYRKYINANRKTK